MASQNPIIDHRRSTVIYDIPAPVKVVWDIMVPNEKFADVAPDTSSIKVVSTRKSGLGTVSRWQTVDRDRFEVITEYKPFEYYGYRVISGDPLRENLILFYPTSTGTRVVFTMRLQTADPNISAVWKKNIVKQFDNIKDKALQRIKSQR